jgi:pilus assembly protein CpaC
MYDNHHMRSRAGRRTALVSAVIGALVLVLASPQLPRAAAQEYDSASVIRKISGRSEKLELTTNSSRILTLEKNIPRVQVNNPELVAVTPLSATDVQISAKKAGVTQVNLWDEDGNIHTIDVLIYGDARELTVALQTQFPHSTIRVYRYSESLVLTGFVDRPDHVGPILRLAEDYAPKVINNISVGGVQQILLKVKVMEVSRTKLRKLGVDWAFEGSDGFAFSSVNEIITRDGQFFFENPLETFSFGIVSNGDSFFATLDALQHRQLAKTLAEPNLVAVSGRPAQFHVGGEFPVPVPQGLNTVSIEYKQFGTIIDFLPLVLGNGNIRLEVRPQVSERDDARGVAIPGAGDLGLIPGIKMRKVDTAVEMKAGQTFALAGLVQERVNTINRGLPYLADLPYIGVPFRRTQDEVEEIELLILVTPEFVDGMDPCEVPCGGPGYFTTSPSNSDLYCGGHIEVPNHVNPTRGLSACGTDPCGTCNPGCNPGGAPCVQSEVVPSPAPPMPHPHDPLPLPGGTGYDDSEGAAMITDQPDPSAAWPGSAPNRRPLRNLPDDLRLPAGGNKPDSIVPESGAGYFSPGHYTPPRQPVYMRNASKPQNPHPAAGQPASQQSEPGLIGPIGYDLD